MLPAALSRMPSTKTTAFILLTLALCVGLAGMLAAPVMRRDSGWAVSVLALHVALFVVALGWGLLVSRGRPRVVLAILGGGCALAAIAAGPWHPFQVSGRHALVYAHVALGAAAVALLSWWAVRRDAGRPPRWAAGIAVALLGLFGGGYGFWEWTRTTWSPPRYNSQACYRFLTATTREQSGAPHFPSAIRSQGAPRRDCAQCHSEPVVTDGTRTRHLDADRSPAYRRTYADFVSRRGEEAGNWCQGCHAPQAITVGARASDDSRDAGGHWCATCHQATDVHALFGNAALQVRGDGDGNLLSVMLRLKAHSDTNLRPALHRSSEFCGSCHRKNWNLPQNNYHWMPGPDEFGQWQSSPFAPAALFASGDRATSRSCIGCHDAHAPDPKPESAGSNPLRLDLFVRRGEGFRNVEPAGDARLKVGEPVRLDVVVHNRGIGHEFPTGMPDLRQSWLEVRGFDGGGREVVRHGRLTADDRLPEEAHRYLLVALDREGKRILHGDLDRMVAVAEWRRIPSGGADLARYSLTVPASGLSRIEVRLLRRQRPEFTRWIGGATNGGLEVVAEGVAAVGAGAASGEDPAFRWRHYGMALASVKAYPEALQALQRSLQLRANDPETLLCLGRVYLDEGDLLAAREQFRRARVGDPERGRAWEGAVLRRMGQPDQAAALLRPLVERHPRDLRLRFELGSTYLAALRNQDAAKEFEAMLDVDPLDVSAHYNLMLCFQRLNRLTDARREETIYRLLRRESQRLPGQPASLEARPLHVHPLEMMP